MKKRYWPLLVYLGILTFCGGLVQAEEDSSVARQMKQIAKNFKTLSGQISDVSKKESSLQLVGSMRKAVANARSMDPAPAAKLEGESLKTYMDEYHKGLDEMDAQLQNLEKAISSDNVKAAQEVLDNLNKLKKVYHSDLR